MKNDYSAIVVIRIRTTDSRCGLILREMSKSNRVLLMFYWISAREKNRI